MAKFSLEEKKLLEKYVTTTDGDVYAVKNLNGIVGAVYARYSRSKTGFRETLLNEFVKEGNLDPQKAVELIERVLIAYGDDSVGELEGAHLSFENISIIATKEIEDRRIGGSPLEKSTRYVFFDNKDEEGNYPYLREPKIMSSRYASEYVETMDYIFNTYANLVEPMKAFYQNIDPIEQAEYDILGNNAKQKLSELKEENYIKSFRRTYNMDIRTKACDSLRCLLPLATKTNVGLFGNGRFWQMLISHLLSTEYPETLKLGEQAFTELSKVIPQYVRRAKRRDYNIKIRQEMQRLANEIFKPMAVDHSRQPVTLMPLAWRNNDDYLIAHMLYAYLNHPFAQIYEVVNRLAESVKLKIKNTYVGQRQTRRDRPGRAFESGYQYTLDLLADFGTYKDLQRHRMNTQLRQDFSPLHGMIVPGDLKTAGYEKQILVCHEKVVGLYKKLKKDLGAVASYVTLHGSQVRWLMGCNDRAAHHLLELRTTPQGHPQYRKLCQQIHTAINQQDPWRAAVMKFVDHNDYSSARGDSEARQRRAEQALNKK